MIDGSRRLGTDAGDGGDVSTKQMGYYLLNSAAGQFIQEAKICSHRIINFRNRYPQFIMTLTARKS